MKTVISARAMFFIVGFCLLLFGPDVAFAQTSNACISPLNSDFYTRFEVLVESSYEETNSAGPVPAGSNSFEYAAIIQLSTNLAGSASVAVLTLPGQTQPTLMREVGDSEFAFGGVTNSFSNVLSVFPYGVYQFTISNTTISVTLPTNSTSPNPPTLVNFVGGQAINATNDYTLTWNPFNTGGVVDFIGVNVISDFSGTVFKSEDFGCPGALDGTATSILIPANTLASNTTYRADITFVKVYTFETNSSTGNALLAGTEAETEATLVTGPIVTPAPAPVLTNAALVPGGGVRFDILTTPGLTYGVEFNSQLNPNTIVNPGGWSFLLTTNAVGNVLSVTNTPPDGGVPGYYRAFVVEPPGPSP